MKILSHVSFIFCYSQRELQLEDEQSRLQQKLREIMALEGEFDKHIGSCVRD